MNTPRMSSGSRRRSSRYSGDAEQEREEGDSRDIGDDEDGEREREDGEGDGESDIDIEMDTEDAQNDHPQPVFHNNESMVRTSLFHPCKKQQFLSVLNSIRIQSSKLSITFSVYFD